MISIYLWTKYYKQTFHLIIYNSYRSIVEKQLNTTDAS